MKHKWMKITIIAAAAAIGAGGVCLGAGAAMGGSPAFYYDKEGIHVRENSDSGRRKDYAMAETKTDAFDNLDISLFEADLEIVSGDSYAVEYLLGGYRKEPEYSLEGGTLRLYENKEHGPSEMRWNGFWGFWGNQSYGSAPNYQVRITIPEDAVLKKVNLNDQYGDIRIKKNLRADQADIGSESGTVTLDGWKGERLTLDQSYGDLVTGKLAGNKVEIYNENGLVKLGKLKADFVEINLTYGDLKADVETVGDMEVDSENGSITLNLDETLEKTGVSLHTESGTIRTPGGMVETDDYELGADYIRMDGDSAGIRAYTRYGDIRIRDSIQ